VLAINGEKDLQVPPYEIFEQLKMLLKPEAIQLYCKRNARTKSFIPDCSNGFSNRVYKDRRDYFSGCTGLYRKWILDHTQKKEK